MNIIKAIDKITDWRLTSQQKLTEWKQKHIYRAGGWTILPTVQISKKDAVIYFLKWGIKI